MEGNLKKILTNDKGKIKCMLNVATQIYCGTEDGYLLIYSTETGEHVTSCKAIQSQINSISYLANHIWTGGLGDIAIWKIDDLLLSNQQSDSFRVKCGYLTKLGGQERSITNPYRKWQRRYFVLFNSGFLNYYKTETTEVSLSPSLLPSFFLSSFPLLPPFLPISLSLPPSFLPPPPSLFPSLLPSLYLLPSYFLPSLSSLASSFLPHSFSHFLFSSPYVLLSIRTSLPPFPILLLLSFSQSTLPLFQYFAFNLSKFSFPLFFSLSPSFLFLSPPSAFASRSPAYPLSPIPFSSFLPSNLRSFPLFPP